MVYSTPGPRQTGQTPGVGRANQARQYRPTSTPRALIGDLLDFRDYDSFWRQSQQRARNRLGAAEQTERRNRAFLQSLLELGSNTYQIYREEKSSQIAGNVLSSPEAQEALANADPRLQAYVRPMLPEDKTNVYTTILRTETTEALGDYVNAYEADARLTGDLLIGKSPQQEAEIVAELDQNLQQGPRWARIRQLAAQDPRAAAQAIPSLQAGMASTRTAARAKRQEARSVNSRNAEFEGIIYTVDRTRQATDAAVQLLPDGAEQEQIIAAVDKADDPGTEAVAAAMVAMKRNPMNGGNAAIAQLAAANFRNRFAGALNEFEQSKGDGLDQSDIDPLLKLQRQVIIALGGFEMADDQTGELGEGLGVLGVALDGGSNLRAVMATINRQLEEQITGAEDVNFMQAQYERTVEALQYGDAAMPRLLEQANQFAARGDYESATKLIDAITPKMARGQNAIDKQETKQQEAMAVEMMARPSEYTVADAVAAHGRGELSTQGFVQVKREIEANGNQYRGMELKQVEDLVMNDPTLQKIKDQMMKNKRFGNDEGTEARVNKRLEMIINKTLVDANAQFIEDTTPGRDNRAVSVNQWLEQNRSGPLIKKLLEKYYAEETAIPTPLSRDEVIRGSMLDLLNSIIRSGGINSESFETYGKPILARMKADSMIRPNRRTGEYTNRQFEMMLVKFAEEQKNSDGSAMFPNFGKTLRDTLENAKRGAGRVMVANQQLKFSAPEERRKPRRTRPPRSGSARTRGADPVSAVIAEPVEMVAVVPAEAANATIAGKGSVVRGWNNAGLTNQDLPLMRADVGATAPQQIETIPYEKFERPLVVGAGVPPTEAGNVQLMNNSPENMANLAGITDGRVELTATTPALPQVPADAPTRPVPTRIADARHPYSLARNYARHYRRQRGGGLPLYTPLPSQRAGYRTTASGSSFERPISFLRDKDANQGGFDLVMQSRETPALVNGRVKAIGADNSGGKQYGNYVVVEFTNPLNGEKADMLIAHLDRVRVKEGQSVGPTTIVGLQGNTGTTSGSPELGVSSYDILEPRPKGSMDVTPYRNRGPLMKMLEDQLHGRVAAQVNAASATPRGRKIAEVAQRLGVDPVDLAMVISFETAGTFDTGIWNKGKTHMGLIQFGADERKQFGVSASQSFDEQMESVYKFLTARGFRPGMSREQMYLTIHGGGPYVNPNLSDGYVTSGGAATWRKIEQHRGNALRTLGWR